MDLKKHDWEMICSHRQPFTMNWKIFLSHVFQSSQTYLGYILHKNCSLSLSFFVALSIQFLNFGSNEKKSPSTRIQPALIRLQMQLLCQSKWQNNNMNVIQKLLFTSESIVRNTKKQILQNNCWITNSLSQKVWK